MEWPADRVERRDTDTLLAYARNARTHSAAQIAQIAASIEQWGWTIPVLVDEDGMLIAGHARVLAARKLRLPQVPTMVARGWTDEQKRAYVIADNKLTLNAGWDDDLLRLELGDLKIAGWDLGMTGFGEDELAALFANANPGLTDPDDAPPVPDEPVTQPGDVWTLGRHRLVCGDATSEVDVSRCLAGVRPHLMVTDPPYGVDYDPNWRAYRRGLWTEGYAVASGRVENDTRADWREAWLLFPGHVAYVWHAALHEAAVVASLVACEFEMRAQIIWSKPRCVISRGHYNWQHEPCLYAVRNGGTAHWAGERGGDSTIWEIPQGRSTETGHGTQKPVTCMKRPMENNSSPGQAVYDPFVGSGTTIIAAEMTGRACHALEISPAYCDVVVERWQNFTGEAATREGTNAG